MSTKHRDQLRAMGDRIVFENDKVRIWELKLEPGAETNVHQHELDVILVVIEGDKVASIQEPDSKSPYDTDYAEADAEPGVVWYLEPGAIEVARNVGTTPYHEVIIELKDQRDR